MTRNAAPRIVEVHCAAQMPAAASVASAIRRRGRRWRAPRKCGPRVTAHELVASLSLGSAPPAASCSASGRATAHPDAHTEREEASALPPSRSQQRSPTHCAAPLSSSSAADSLEFAAAAEHRQRRQPRTAMAADADAGRTSEASWPLCDRTACCWILWGGSAS